MAHILMTALFLIGALLCHGVSSFPEAGPMTIKAATPEIINLLSTHQKSPTEVFAQAESLIISLRSAPSCHQAATVDLIDSCHSLGQGYDSTMTKDVEKMLDATRNEYAVKLAACELNSAQASVPKQCARFTPSIEACKDSDWFKSTKGSVQPRQTNDGTCYPHYSLTHVQRCITALSDKAQTWTSYSNARQNAMVVCHASREAIDRETLIHTFKSMVKSTGDLVAASDNAIKRQEEAAVAAEKWLIKLQDEVLRKTRDYDIEVNEMFKRVKAHVAGLHGDLGKTVSSLEAFQGDVTQGRTYMDNLNAQFLSFITRLSESQDLAADQKHHMQIVTEHAKRIAKLMQKMPMEELDQLRGGLATASQMTDHIVQMSSFHIAQIKNETQQMTILANTSAHARENVESIKNNISDFMNLFNSMREFGSELFFLSTLMFMHYISKWFLEEKTRDTFFQLFALPWIIRVFWPLLPRAFLTETLLPHIYAILSAFTVVVIVAVASVVGYRRSKASPISPQV
ncbi:hypothetical protein NA57DRAFT_77147 [Rhizodiscina lignyota]|uniref:Uncharacterized protein n=1 Tax=Rhizodiscina lignyota TaxID=1504668 RepID=A0A9P4IH34_9PEZI|nr:hypothetical protein NA57DRAFT_77147 [Rhizodiscina lignyota]